MNSKIKKSVKTSLNSKASIQLKVFLALAIFGLASAILFTSVFAWVGVHLDSPAIDSNITGTYTFTASTSPDKDNVTFYWWNSTSSTWKLLCSNATTGTLFTCSYDTSNLPTSNGNIFNATTNDSISTNATGVNIANCGSVVTSSVILTANLTGCSGNGLIINASNVMLDCAGHSIGGDYTSSDDGVKILINSDNVTITNCTIYGFNAGHGIYASLDNYEDISILDNTFYDNGYGISLIPTNLGTNYYTITGNNILNTITSGGSAIYVRDGVSSLIDSNNITNAAGVGIYMAGGSGTISNNIVTNASSNKGIYADVVDYTLIDSNNVSFSQTGLAVSTSSGGNNITNNNIFNNSWQGLNVNNNGIDTTLVWHNNIYNNVGGIGNSQVYGPYAIELSNGSDGNYWGRDSCPVFTPGVDSNLANVRDSYAYNISNGWETIAPADCLACGDTIINSTILTANLTNCSGNGINVNASNIIIDCAGYSISGNSSSGAGIFIEPSLNNITVKNCILFGFNTSGGAGIRIKIALTPGAKNITIINNTFFNDYDGINTYLSTYGLYNVTIQNNNFLNGTNYGIVGSPQNSTIIDNTISNYGGLIQLYNSGNNVIKDNILNYTTASSAIVLSSSYGSGYIASDTIQNNSITYSADHGIQIDSTYGFNNKLVILDNNITNNVNEGLGIDNVTAKTIYHNNIYDNNAGGAQVNSPLAIELSNDSEGNYWGRTSCPYFNATEDSGDESVIDTFPYATESGWDVAEAPAVCFACGTEYCGCGDNIPGDVSLSSNLTCNGTAMVVYSHDVTINCNGYAITGNGSGNGIEANGYDDLNIINCVVSNFSTGIYWDYVTNSVISGGEIGPNNQDLSGNGGIYNFDGSTNNTITGVYLHENKGGAILIEDASENIVIENCNIVDNCGDSREIYVSESSNITIRNNNITDGTGYGIEARDSDYLNIFNNNISSNFWEGIYMVGVYYSSISDNIIFDNNWGGTHQISGIDLYSSGSNIIQDNEIRCTEAGTNYEGIRIESPIGPAEDNELSGNEIHHCAYGLYSENIDHFSAYNEEYHNNTYGVSLSSVGVDETLMPEILNSDVYNNVHGITLLSSSIVNIQNTNFTNNDAITSGLNVESGSEVYLNNGNFVDNFAFGINSAGSIYWTLTNDSYCTDNDLYIADGFIVPLGGKIIDANCTINLNGEVFNTSGGQTGSYVEVIDEFVDNVFGSADYGVEGEIYTDAGTYTGDLVVNFYDQNPGTSGYYLEEFGVWIDASLEPEPADLDWWILKIYYTDEDLAAAGLTEDSLEIQFYNAALGTWIVESDQGVNKTDNYVWVNLTHFSVFGLFGSAPTSETPGSSSGGSSSVPPAGTTTSWTTGGTINQSMIVNDNIAFTVSSETHNMKLISLGADYALLQISSDPFTVTVKVGEQKIIDVNKDGTDDITATLDKVYLGKAYFTFGEILYNGMVDKGFSEPLEEETSVIKQPGTESPTVTPAATTAKDYSMIVVIVLIAAILAILWFMFKPKN